MSKVLTILCATALCFAVASAAHYSGMLGRNAVTNHVNFALTEVRSALRRLNLQSAVIESGPSRQNHNTIEQFKVNITREIEEMRPLIDIIIKDANSTFNETQCRSFWLEYEAAGRSLVCNMKTTIPTTVNATLAEIKKAINATTDALTKLKRLSGLANSCEAYVCHKINKEVGIAYHDFAQKTRSVLCRGSRLAEASKIEQVVRIENLYGEYLKKSNGLIMNTVACVNTTRHYT